MEVGSIRFYTFQVAGRKNKVIADSHRTVTRARTYTLHRGYTNLCEQCNIADDTYVIIIANRIIALGPSGFHLRKTNSQVSKQNER